jgi:hypothetical protein
MNENYYSFNSYETYIKSKRSQIMWEKKRQEEIDMNRDWVDPLEEIMNRTSDIGEERFRREYTNSPIEVSDGLRVEEMHKRILRQMDQISAYALAKTALQADNDDLRKQNDELIKENQELRIENDQIYSRFDVLDL